MTAIQLTLMTVDEARATVEQIKARLDDVRALLYELREREGWRALGYASWQACINAEFHMSRMQAHRLLNAHMVDRILSGADDGVTHGLHPEPEQDSTTVESAPIPERHARELAPLVAQPEALREVYAEVREVTGGRPTAPAIREAVDRRLARSEPSVAEIFAATADEHDDFAARWEENERRNIAAKAWHAALAPAGYLTLDPAAVVASQEPAHVRQDIGSLETVIEYLTRLLDEARRASAEPARLEVIS